MAERLARQALANRPGAAVRVQISSAGSHAEAGHPMHPYTESTLRERGADPDGFASRRLSADLVTAADLILTADRQQRAACVTLAPSAVHRTFTLRQFGRFAEAFPAELLAGTSEPHERLLALRDQVKVLRAELPVVPGELADLADPVLGPPAAFERCADEISDVLDAIVDLIVPA
jgi:protein-tyrosine phosphatase